MRGQLGMAVVVIALYRGLLDGPVHPLDLSIGPRMLDPGKPVFDPVFAAAHVEHVGHVTGGWPIGVARREGELGG